MMMTLGRRLPAGACALRVPMRKALDDLLARYDALVVAHPHGALAPPIGYDFDKPPVAPGTPSPSPSPSPGAARARRHSRREPRRPARALRAERLRQGQPAHVAAVPGAGLLRGDARVARRPLPAGHGLAHEEAPRPEGLTAWSSTHGSGPPSVPRDPRKSEAEPLLGDGTRGLAEPGRAPVRLAHPPARRLRRLRARDEPASATGRLHGVHLCMVRLELMRINTAPALDPGALADVARLERLIFTRAARSRPSAVARWSGGRVTRDSVSSPGTKPTSPPRTASKPPPPTASRST